MLILAIDTASVAASAAVIDENKLYGEIFTDFKLKHSEKIMVMTDDLFKNLRMNISQIDAFAVSKGPGSFTGLRIGAATVKGFAQALDKPIIGVSTLSACAYMHNETDRLICPIFDAQQNSLYAALYRYDGNTRTEIIDDCVITLDELSRDLNKRGEKVLFCGDAVNKYRETLTEICKCDIRFAEAVSMMPRASAAGALALEEYNKGNYCSYDDFKPVYIRKSQAEVNYKVKL